MSTNFARTLAWKHDHDVKLWRHKHWMNPSPTKIFCVRHWHKMYIILHALSLVVQCASVMNILSASPVRRPEQNTAFNAKTEQWRCQPRRGRVLRGAVLKNFTAYWQRCVTFKNWKPRQCHLPRGHFTTNYGFLRNKKMFRKLSSKEIFACLSVSASAKTNSV